MAEINVLSVISRSPEVMGGTPVFLGTRVPVATLLDYLKAGDSINDFLAGFPTVTKDQVVVVIEGLGQQMMDGAALR
ncbi:DUF433 domain-containing protein [Prochlorothrix hollandica]|uniref:DUF433 domain-containing protein n=1 Tax=Prochlorothrix hollandica PCC 9006 = CALU 1027 TaxID=317619 RepID=A0A0M2PVG8_PROHO|nr:DUF433 domain-containing protein [Prochlorothrix hollandica]KKI99092.1 hypothetical protein PROH_15010 [Prochlorothrix hollandica PCC 9006 = CALU 1027]